MNERKLFQSITKKEKIKNEKVQVNFEKNYKTFKFKSTKGITLIALVISIIVMLILAGVSLNATIGDNGIITQAQNATYMQSIAALEEYLNNYYVEHYDEMSIEESKVLKLTQMQPNWFYIPSNEGIGSLSYVVDSDGHALYLIKKSGLPDDIKNQIKGGEAGDGSYSEYVGLNDVYGVTSNLQVYYCSKGTDSILGKTVEDLDSDNPRRQVFKVAENADIYNLLKDFDNTDGTSDGVLTSEELKSVKEITINEENKINSFSGFYNLPSLRKINFKNVQIDNLEGIENCALLSEINFEGSKINKYNAIGKLGTKLKILVLYNVNDDEVEKLCSIENGIAKYDMANLEKFAIVGSKSYLFEKNEASEALNSSGKSPNVITNLSPLANLTTTTKNAVKELCLQNNLLNDNSLINIADYTNVELLRVEYNNLTVLDGIENMNKLKYLYATNNKLGKNENDSNRSENDSLKSLENLQQLYYLNIYGNSELKYLNYISNLKELRYMYAKECKKINVESLQEISNIVKQCVKFTIDGKYDLVFLDNKSEINLSNQAIEKDIFYSLENKENIEVLNLENLNLTEDGQKIDDSEVNSVINKVVKSLKNLISLRCNATSEEYSIADISNLELSNNLNLKELDLRGTKVQDLKELNQLSKLEVLLIDNSNINLLEIQDTISRLWGSYYQSADMQVNGLYIGNANLLKQLENCTNITQLNLAGGSIDRYNITKGINLDLSKCTKLKKVTFNRILSLVKFPNSLEEYSGFTNSLNDFSLCENLKKINMNGYAKDALNETDFFNTLVTCQAKFELIFSVYCVGKENQFIDKLQILKDSKIEAISFYADTNNDIWQFKDLRYISQLISLKSISIQQGKLEGLAGIENLENLQRVRILKTNLKNLKGISDLNNRIKLLQLNDNKINDITGIENLINIQTADFSNNNISSIKQIETNYSLVSLDLSNNCLFDTSTYTDNNGNVCKYNNLEILAQLNKKGKLKVLYMEGNYSIIDWSPVSNLKWNSKSGW